MKLFAWDFHGVLEKDNESAVIQISNRVLRNLGYKEQFTEEDNRNLYGKKWYEYFEYLLPNEPHQKHLKLQQACIKLEEDEPDIVDNNIKPNDFAIEVLSKIENSGHDQILISNMSDVALERFMHAIDVTRFFPKGKAFPCNTRNGTKTYTKLEVLKNYIKNKNFEEIIAIGDTAADMLLKNAANNVATYLYVHQHLKHPHVEADHKINDLREVLGEI